MSLGPIDFDTSTLRDNDMHGRTFTISVAAALKNKNL